MDGVSELLVEEVIQVVQFVKPHTFIQAFKRQVALVVKNLPANMRDATDTGSVPGWGRSPGEGNGKPLQYSCLEKFRGERSLVGYSPWVQRVRHV